MNRAAAIVGALVFLTVGCGEDGSSKSPQPVNFSGSIRVDSIGGVRYVANRDECVGTARLGQLLNPPADDVVVISDPSGREIGLLPITRTWYETYEDKGETFVSPGVCNFEFGGEIPVDQEEGVYRASVPELGIESRFNLNDARIIELNLRP